MPRIEEKGKEVVKVKQEVALNKNNNYYGILEVDQDATEEEIKNAYRRLALKWHPDRFGTNEREKKQAEVRFKKIGSAYAVLSDKKRKWEYDMSQGISRNYDFDDITIILKGLQEEGEEELNWIRIRREQFDRERVVHSINLMFMELEISEDDLGSNYQDWRKKVKEIEISELNSFEKQMTTIMFVAMREKVRRKRKKVNIIASSSNNNHSESSKKIEPVLLGNRKEASSSSSVRHKEVLSSVYKGKSFLDKVLGFFPGREKFVGSLALTPGQSIIETERVEREVKEDRVVIRKEVRKDRRNLKAEQVANSPRTFFFRREKSG